MFQNRGASYSQVFSQNEIQGSPIFLLTGIKQKIEKIQNLEYWLLT